MVIQRGRYDVTIDEHNIIYVRLAGTFTAPSVIGFTKRVRDCVQKLNGEPFAILVNDLEFLGGTPDGYEVLEKYNQWLNTQPLVAKAMVIKSSLALGIIDQRSPARKKQNLANFSNEQDAIAWLKTQFPSH